MTYKAKDGTEWEGLHPNEDGIGVCDKCGSTKIKMVSHIECFTNWCIHWASDELKWIGGDTE